MAPKRVLVIDDEELIQEVIQASLEDIGEWSVLLASSGSEGLTVAASQSPDVILLDVSMPVMNGIETLKKLRDNSTTQEIPVIFLTAKVQPTDKAIFSQLDVAGLIAKPFEVMTLAQQVAKILGWEL
jgi:CheY-like chemotaxis protein